MGKFPSIPIFQMTLYKASKLSGRPNFIEKIFVITDITTSPLHGSIIRMQHVPVFLLDGLEQLLLPSTNTGNRVSFETSFDSKQPKLEPKLVSALSETKRLFRLFRFYTETESFDVSIEPKQTEDQPKLFDREHILLFLQKNWVFPFFSSFFSVFFGLF
jgi:hypothetical protein